MEKTSQAGDRHKTVDEIGQLLEAVNARQGEGAIARQYDNESDFKIEVVSDGIVISKYQGSKPDVRIPPRIQNLPVTGIGKGAFEACTGLASVTIPSSVTIIGNVAFYGCSSLTSVSIPSSVTIIGIFAFSGCSSLASVTIPSGVTSIGGFAFSRCSSLTSVTFAGTIPADWFFEDAFDGDLRDKYLAGGIGTYTRANGSDTWAKQ